MSASNPVRYPDTRSRPLMTKRAWWLVATGILIPGAPQVLAGNRRLGRFALRSTLILWVAVLALIAGLLFARATLIQVFTNPIVLWLVAAALLFYAVLWLILGLDTLRLVRLVKTAPRARVFIAGLSLASIVVVTATSAYGIASAVAAIGVIDQVFSDGTVAEPIDGRYNILLLGGDAGPDRVGLRPDSISVASVDADTGQVVMFGVPRNLEQAPFREESPLYDPYPDGYSCGDDCLISYLYTYGQEHPQLYPDAADQGSSPGIESMRDAVEGVLGLKLQYYVLIDMKGFAELIDALGGIDIDVAQRLPYGSNTDAYGNPVPPIGYIEAGKQHMNGSLALWYARSRYGTTDYERMQRQRQVQEAIFEQADPATVISRFQGIAAAGAQVVSTDIPQAMLGHFADLALQSRQHEVEKVEFVPPAWDVVHPDFGAIHDEVDSRLAPPAATEG